MFTMLRDDNDDDDSDDHVDDDHSNYDNDNDDKHGGGSDDRGRTNTDTRADGKGRDGAGDDGRRKTTDTHADGRGRGGATRKAGGRRPAHDAHAAGTGRGNQADGGTTTTTGPIPSIRITTAPMRDKRPTQRWHARRAAPGGHGMHRAGATPGSPRPAFEGNHPSTLTAPGRVKFGAKTTRVFEKDSITASQQTADHPARAASPGPTIDGAPSVHVLTNLAASPDTSIPLAIKVTAASTKPSAAGRARHDQPVAWDSGSGASFVEKVFATSIGARIVTASSPMFFHGFTDAEHSHTRVDQKATINTTVGEYTRDYEFWVTTGAPLPLLVGRDMMSRKHGRGCVLDPDTDAPTMTFDGHAPAPAILSSTPVPRQVLAALVTAASATTIGAGLYDMVPAGVDEPPGTDVYVHEHTYDKIHTPPQVQRVDDAGRISLLVHNHGQSAVDIPDGAEFSRAQRVSAAPLNPVTAAVARAPTATAAAAVLLTEVQPQSSAQVRGATWKGGAVGGTFESEAAATAAFKKNLPTAAELDGVLLQAVADAQVGSKEQHRRLLRILRKHARGGLWSTREAKTGCIEGHTVSIRLKDGDPTSTPIFSKPYPHTPVQANEILRQAEEAYREKLIKPTVSNSNYPVILVAKAPGAAPRVTYDLRQLNSRLLTEWWEVPNIRHLTAELGRDRVFSTADYSNGYGQVPLADDGSSDHIAFTLPRGDSKLSGKRFSHTRLVQGMKDALFRFQRIVHHILAEHMSPHGDVHQYVDDLICASGRDMKHLPAIIDRHISQLDAMFTTLQESGTKLSPHKLQLLRSEIETLGHTINGEHGTITVSKEKTAAIRELREPKTRKELEVAMGILGVARRFTPGYAALAEPLFQLLRKGWREFSFEPEHRAAYEKLKERFTTTEALAAPDFAKPFEIHADASGTATGSLLLQRDDAGMPRVIEYFSHQLSAAEQNYSASEREALALLLSCKRWRQYLLCSNKFDVSLRTDNRGLVWAHRNASSSSKLWRWCQQLADFNYDITWCAGTDNGPADALSRLTGWIGTTTAMMAATPVFTTTATTTTTDTYVIERLVAEYVLPKTKAKYFRVRWQGYPDPNDDTIESLASLRGQLSATVLGALRGQLEASETRAADAALTIPPGYAEQGRHLRQVHVDGGNERDDGDIDNNKGTDNHGNNDDDNNNGSNDNGDKNGNDGDDANNNNNDTGGTTTRVDGATGVEQDQHGWDAPGPHGVPVPDTPPPAAYNAFAGNKLLPALTVGDVVKHQRADDRTRGIINHIGDYPRHRVHDSGLLMRQYTPTQGPRKGQPLDTIVLPDGPLVKLALASTHDATGHHGTTATLFAVQSRFWFPRLVERTRKYVAACKTCARAKRDLRPTPMGKTPTYDYLQQVHIDFAGPMPTNTPDGKRHLCIIVCAGTKFVHCVPTRSTTAADATTALLDFIQHNGIPGRIHSDRGSSFCNEAWRGLMAALNTKHTTTTAYNPQGNGACEAQVKNIKALIKIIGQNFPREWAACAGWAVWSYNQSYNSTIGTTPTFARTGREARSIPDIIFNNPTANDSLTLSQLITRVRAVHKTTQDRIARQHDAYIRKNAGLHKVHDYAEGDKVWLHRVYPGISRQASGGHCKAFYWPFRPELYQITSKSAEQHVEIKHIDSGKTQHVHTRRLKPYRPQHDAFDFGDLTIQEDTAEPPDAP